MAYTVPTAADLKARYPNFTSVDNTVIEYWITDAQRLVTEAWMETDYAVGIIEYAAHRMSLIGLGAAAQAANGLPAGVTRFKSGSFEANFSEQQANASASGDYTATPYGMEFKRLLRRNVGGPIVGDTGTLPYNPLQHFVDGGA